MKVQRFDYFATVEHFDIAAPGATPAVKLSGDVAIQIFGGTGDMNASVERSTLDPNDPAGGNWAQALPANLTGPEQQHTLTADGGVVGCYNEPAVAWWRVRFLTLTGSTLVSISGGGA